MTHPVKAMKITHFTKSQAQRYVGGEGCDVDFRFLSARTSPYANTGDFKNNAKDRKNDTRARYSKHS
jgi:hypothetical protein